jgi:hypothetical protein
MKIPIFLKTHINPKKPAQKIIIVGNRRIERVALSPSSRNPIIIGRIDIENWIWDVGAVKNRIPVPFIPCIIKHLIKESNEIVPMTMLRVISCLFPVTLLVAAEKKMN